MEMAGVSKKCDVTETVLTSASFAVTRAKYVLNRRSRKILRIAAEVALAFLARHSRNERWIFRIFEIFEPQYLMCSRLSRYSLRRTIFKPSHEIRVE